MIERRLPRLALAMAAALALTACGNGKPVVTKQVERRNETTVDIVPDHKATSIRLLVQGRYSPERGLLTLVAQKETTGEMHRVASYDEATITVTGKEPEGVAPDVGGAVMLGLNVAFSIIDANARNQAKKALIGEETKREVTVVRRIEQQGQPLGQIGTALVPLAGQVISWAIEDGPVRQATADPTGTVEINLLDMIDDPKVLLGRDSLSIRARIAAEGREGDAALYLGPADLADMIRTAARTAFAAARKSTEANDYPKAFRPMRLAAELGVPEAQAHLSQLYRDGLGVPQNAVESARWAARAAAQGNPEGQLYLAQRLARGNGLPRDDVGAYMWSILAGAQMTSFLRNETVFERELLVKRLSPEEVSRAQAMAAAFQPRPEVPNRREENAIRTATLEPAPALDPSRLKGKSKRDAVALVIGVEDYVHLPAAQFAGRDARSFRDFAVNVLGIAPNRVKLLVNAEARQLDIQKSLSTWLKPEIADGATDVYVFFSGHGLASPDGRDLFLFPHDGDQSILDMSAIERRALIETIMAAGARSLTLFLDTCYSGGTRGDESLLADARPVMIVSPEDRLPPAATILAAARNNQLSSSYPAARHGLFSYFLMRGLMGEADLDGDRAITLGELQGFAERHVRREASRRGRDQNPVLSGPADKVIARW